MALMDDIEFYGRAVDAGDMPHADAVRLLVRDSNGGLTEYGAAVSLAEWTTTRTDMIALMDTAAENLRRVRGF